MGHWSVRYRSPDGLRLIDVEFEDIFSVHELNTNGLPKLYYRAFALPKCTLIQDISYVDMDKRNMLLCITQPMLNDHIFKVGNEFYFIYIFYEQILIIFESISFYFHFHSTIVCNK